MIGAVCIMPALYSQWGFLCLWVCVTWEDVHLALCITTQWEDKETFPKWGFISFCLPACLSWYGIYKPGYQSTTPVCQPADPPAFLAQLQQKLQLSAPKLNSFHPYCTYVTAHLCSYGLFVCISSSLICSDAFAQVLSQCMRVIESECVGGRVKNECHFECMNAVVFDYVSSRGEGLNVDLTPCPSCFHSVFSRV